MHSYGLVLRAVRYGDTDVIVNVFTETAGTVPFIVRKGKASTWQPLSLVEVVWDEHSRTNIYKPRELTLWRPWHSLPFQPDKAAMSLFLGEFLGHALRSEQANGPLFDYLVNGLTWFDESEQNYVNFHIVFLLHLTQFLGFLPNVDDWHKGYFFDLEAATFTRARPLHVHYLNPDESALVPKFLRMNIRSMRAVGLNGVMRRRALEIVAAFYRLHIPEFPELQSLSVLAEVFA